MSVEIKRLHLASLRGSDGLEWPVHGFVVMHPDGSVLVDTGVGGPPQVLGDWRVVNRSVADALAGLDRDAEVLPGLSVIATPGHTVGHQCVAVRSASAGADLMIGDAAYTPRQYLSPAEANLPPGQASDLASWQDSLRRIRALGPARVHCCHRADVIHG